MALTESKIALAEFMQTDFYLNYLDDLDKELPVKIDRLVIVDDFILELEIGFLNYASMTLNDIKWLIENYRCETIHYILKKLKKYSEPDAGKDDIIILPPRIYLPISHLVEYYLLLVRPNDLREYVKNIKIPHPKKYIKEIKEMFSEIQSL